MRLMLLVVVPSGGLSLSFVSYLWTQKMREINKKEVHKLIVFPKNQISDKPSIGNVFWYKRKWPMKVPLKTNNLPDSCLFSFSLSLKKERRERDAGKINPRHETHQPNLYKIMVELGLSLNVLSLKPA
jgi:hypothetical protein